MLFKFKTTKNNDLGFFISRIFLGIIVIGGILNLFANKTYTEDSWTVGEWLINYQGGFVRRGFSGELIYFFSTLFKFSPIYIIWLISFLSYIFLIKETLKIAKDKISTAFLLSPVVFLAPLVGNFLIRKDIFLLLLFLLILKILKNKKPNIILCQVINVLGILIHEVFAIYSLPIQIFIILNKLRKGNKVSGMLISFLIPIITFLICLIFKGNMDQAINIHNSWLNQEYLFHLKI